MKKSILVTLTTFFVFNFSIAQAVNHSTQENFNYCFQMCVSAINDTEDYADLIMNRNHDVAVIRRQDCNTLKETLEFFWHNDSAKGAESLTLMIETTTIILERYLTLDYFISALDAGVAGNMTLFEEYKRKMLQSLESSLRLRQDFKSKYGY